MQINLMTNKMQIVLMTRQLCQIFQQYMSYLKNYEYQGY